jgi:hypothetical protein
MKKLAIATVALIAVAAFAVASLAADRDGGGFRAHLNGWQEDPSQVTNGVGDFRAKVVNGTIEYTLAYEALDSPAAQAHIHIGSRHESGGISAFLCGGGDKPPCPPLAGEVSGVIDASDVIGPAGQGVEPGNIDDLLRAMRRGETYANVHTPPRAPGGEIRGQIRDGRRGEG